ncbi:MAG: phenylacetic acid degradation b [Bacteroidetes bacterium]|nr:phenylacetic acid degradation b [Bacteroidota bacterium]MBS1539507.1 phenylacetic acid degradation b [Bacteroidota bacterium]
MGKDSKKPLDQFSTFEVFVQAKEGKPFQHEGAVHAPNLEMAYILAKETFTRRFTCSSLYVVNTLDVVTSPTTEGTETVYNLIDEVKDGTDKKEFEIYQLAKRGKQHVHAGTVQAGSPAGAMSKAKSLFGIGKTIYNVWAVEKNKIRFTTDAEKDLWHTLPEKKFRDASDYKGGDKLKEFLERTKA